MSNLISVSGCPKVQGTLHKLRHHIFKKGDKGVFNNYVACFRTNLYNLTIYYPRAAGQILKNYAYITSCNNADKSCKSGLTFTQKKVEISKKQ